MPITLRNVKGSALTHIEVDSNFAERFVSVSHSLSIGDGVKVAWSLSQADDIDNVASGIVAFVEDADTVWIATQDGVVVTWTSHGLGTGVAYDSQSTPGAFTTTRPPTGVIRPFLKIIDTNTVMIERGAIENV